MVGSCYTVYEKAKCIGGQLIGAQVNLAGLSLTILKYECIWWEYAEISYKFAKSQITKWPTYRAGVGTTKKSVGMQPQCSKIWLSKMLTFGVFVGLILEGSKKVANL